MNFKSIITKKTDAKITIYVVLYFMILIFCLVILKEYREHILYNTKIDLEDSLAVSVLSSVLIDDEIVEDSFNELLTLGLTEEEAYKNATLFVEPYSAYDNMQEYLKLNLGLSESWEYVENPYVDTITLENYIVYNVITVVENGTFRKDIEVYEFANGSLSSHDYFTNGVADGSVISPNGTTIKNTCCYARIGFILQGLFDAEYYKYRDKLVGAGVLNKE